ncbi:MAG: hypothetical protein BroJett026_04660 [Betaproteobacteria bacterium]|nr:MAG: hypothetical protein BroJett026_04660 [Betaproteobacteria bacterium]
MVAAIALAAVCVAGAANAQTLNFDDVCAAPPCAAANAYQAPWGVTLAPAHSIVAGGVDQLVGRNGTKYLSVATAPYQATITLPRVATYASLQVSRSSLTAAGQTVSLQALRNGAPVGTPHTATLGDVDTWTVLRVNVANGFDALFVSSAFGSANRTFGIDDVRIAGHCAGFADVADSDIFCAAAEWLYNRGVTTGCTMGTYCPAAAVTRAQMALFMQRLGNAVTPVTAWGAVASAGFQYSDTPRPLNCAIVRSFDVPKQVVLAATANISGTTSAGAFAFRVRQSTDGGQTWSDPIGYPGLVSVGANQFGHATFHAIVNLFPGREYLFQGHLGTMAGPNQTASVSCHLIATFYDRPATEAPFDAAADAP